MYSTDGRLVDRRLEPYSSDLSNNNVGNEPGFVYRHDSAQSCTAIASDLYRPFGMTTLVSGEICVTYKVPKGIGYAPEIACWDGQRWVPDLKIRILGVNAEGIVAYEDRLWVTSYTFLGTPEPLGLLTSVTDGTDGTEEVYIYLPHFHFLTTLEDGTLLASSFSETIGGGISEGAVFRVVIDKTAAESSNIEGLKYLPGESVQQVSDDFNFPSGILSLGYSALVADFARGELKEVNWNGQTLRTYGGFDGPMGIKRAPNGDICVAEMLGSKISCVALDLLREHD